MTKSEVNHTFKYLLLYDETYYKIGLIDSSYSIINTGAIAMTYHPYGEKMPLTIQTDLGFCVVMPIKYERGLDPEEEGKMVVKIE